MKDYVLIIKTGTEKQYFECKDMREVENKMFEYAKHTMHIIDFEVYKSVDIDEVINLTSLCFKRFINKLK